MNKQVIAGIIAAIVIIGGIALYANNQKQQRLAAEQQRMEQEKMEADKMKGEAMMEKTDDAMMKKEGEAMEGDAMKKEDGAMMKKEGAYRDYSTATVAAEQKTGNKVVLFFHATWCPDCKAADAAFKATPSLIPAGITVLKTDYDSNAELKKKYGVTYQHTFVQIDNSGNKVTSWVSGDVALLTKNVK